MSRTGSARLHVLFASVRALVSAGVLVAGYFLLPLDSVFTATTALGLAAKAGRLDSRRR